MPRWKDWSLPKRRPKSAVMTTNAPQLTASDITEFLADVFPQMTGRMVIEDVAAMTARTRLLVKDGDLRPGGTVSGPSMFALADCAFYVAVIAMIGKEALAVTTSATINFMRRPEPGDLVADARILKLGRSLAVGDVTLFSATGGPPVAHASMTYSIPPKPSGIGVS